MTEIPEYIMKAATVTASRWYHEEWEPDEYICKLLVRYIAEDLFDERKRCIAICSAEREWEGDISEVQQRIERGEQPRRLAGWNYFP